MSADTLLLPITDRTLSFIDATVYGHMVEGMRLLTPFANHELAERHLLDARALAAEFSMSKRVYDAILQEAAKEVTGL